MLSSQTFYEKTEMRALWSKMDFSHFLFFFVNRFSGFGHL